MQLTITEKKENPLLQRTEVRGTLVYEGITPTNNDVAQAVAKEVKGDVLVKHIYTRFSHQQATFEADVYKDSAARKKTEKLTKHLRKKLEEEENKKAEEAAAKKAEEEKAAAAKEQEKQEGEA